MNPPDDSACWAGEWNTVEPMVDLWAHSAVLRTVRALPSLHPWRLGDTKGSRRSLVWCASPGADEQGVAVLTQTAPPPSLGLGDVGADGELLGAGALAASCSVTGGLLGTLAAGLTREVADAVADAVARPGPSSEPVTDATTEPYRPDGPHVQRWVGAVAQLPGAWLPDLAILPRSRRDVDDPGTRWSTESIDFALRHSVHAADQRYASDVLAPHVTALVLEHVPDDAAVTIAGDGLHVWWQYTAQSRLSDGRTRRTVEVAQRLREALPSFVLADHPDHSHRVEERMAERAAQAAAYRAGRRTGQHQDPTMQRIYAQAQADYRAGRSAT
jgi:hypothetical protein